VSNPRCAERFDRLTSAPAGHRRLYRYADGPGRNGTFDVVGFAEDSAGRRCPNVVTVTIQSAANDVTAPLVSHKIGAASEVAIRIIGRATGRERDAWIGFRARPAPRAYLLKFDT